MHHDDTTLARVSLDYLQQPLHRITRIIIVRQHIPKIDGVSSIQQGFLLRETHSSMRWTKQFGLQQLLTHLRICHILSITCLIPTHMVVGMIAYRMPLGSHSSHQLWITRGIFCHHKEASLHTIVCQYIQHLRRATRYRTIVESEINHLRRRIHPPYHTLIQALQPSRKLI